MVVGGKINWWRARSRARLAQKAAKDSGSNSDSDDSESGDSISVEPDWRVGDGAESDILEVSSSGECSGLRKRWQKTDARLRYAYIGEYE